MDDKDVVVNDMIEQLTEYFDFNDEFEIKEFERYVKKELEDYCDDAISRQEAKRAIEALQRPIMREESNYYQFKFSGMSEALGAVENLPSVTPQQRTGRWIDSHIPESTLCECSECGFTCGAYSFNYCPDCGAKMKAE